MTYFRKSTQRMDHAMRMRYPTSIAGMFINTAIQPSFIYTDFIVNPKTGRKASCLRKPVLEIMIRYGRELQVPSDYGLRLGNILEIIECDR